MHKKFITFIVASAMAITGVMSQPAQAGDDDIAKWIAGLAALAIIGAAVADNNRSKSKPAYTQTPQPRQNNLLPARCRINENIHGQKIQGLSRQCLRRSNVNVQSLPRECAVKLRNRHQGRDEVIYGGRCLKSHGYRLARH